MIITQLVLSNTVDRLARCETLAVGADGVVVPVDAATLKFGHQVFN